MGLMLKRFLSYVFSKEVRLLIDKVKDLESKLSDAEKREVALRCRLDSYERGYG